MNFISEDDWDRVVVGVDWGVEEKSFPDRDPIVMRDPNKRGKYVVVGFRYSDGRIVWLEEDKAPDNSPSLSQSKDNSPMLGGDKKLKKE